MGKKILVLSANAGFGHRSASKALVAAIEAEYGDWEVLVANPLDSASTPPWLRESQSDYDRIARDLPKLWKFGYDLSDKAAVSAFVENSLAVVLFRSLRDCLRASAPDLVISTYPLYQPALGAVFALEGRRIPLVCVVTDLATVHSTWFSSAPDLTVVPTPLVRDLGLAAGLEPSRLEVIGIPVDPRIAADTRSKEELRASLGWEPGLTTFFAVGSKRVGRLPEVLNALNHSGLPLQLAIAAGGDKALYGRLASQTWHLPTKLYDFVEDMPTLLRASDAVISKAGGLIVTESLAAGKPLILMDVLPGQEVGNADYVVQGGAGELAIEPISCLEAAFHWLEGGGRLLEKRTAAAVALGRPRAASEIVRRALEVAAAGPRDSELKQLRDRVVELFERFGESWED